MNAWDKWFGLGERCSKYQTTVDETMKISFIIVS